MMWKSSSNYNADGEKAYIALGVGASSSLFNRSIIGTLATVPHDSSIDSKQYRQFLAIFEVGTYSNQEIVMSDKPSIFAVLDAMALESSRKLKGARVKKRTGENQEQTTSFKEPSRYSRIFVKGFRKL